MSNSYFEKKGYISASFLKALADNPSSAKAMIDGIERKATEALDFGSLYDCLMTTPDRFSTDYIIYEGKKPTDKMLDFANAFISIYNSIEDLTTYDRTNTIMSARNESGYDSRLLPATVIKKFEEECEAYCTFSIANKDLIIIDRATYDSAIQLVNITKESPYLKDIFEPDSNKIVLFQVPIYVTTTKFTGKILIDCLVIDLLKKTITPYDFKTFEGSFESNYWKFRYYYQESWYTFILETLRNPEFFIECDIPEELKIIHSGEFSIEQFKFIAVDKAMYKPVEVFESYTGIAQDVVFNGRINKNEYLVRVKSILSLIEEASYRASVDNWRDDYQMLTNGVKKLWL